MRALCLLLLLFGMVQVSAAEDIERLQSLNRQLKAEMELAKKSQLYVVFDPAQRQILLKTSGMTLSTLSVKRLIQWGGVPDAKLRKLASKEAQQAPQREKINPTPVEESEAAKPATPPPTAGSNAAPKKFELQALEIDDMPANYQLHFDDGLLITVRAEAEEAGGLRSFFLRCWWYLSRPLISLWSYFAGTTYNETIVTMSLRDARQLYWSFTPEMSCLFLHNAADD